MSKICNVQIHINGQETFFLNEKILSTYSEKLRKIVTQERKRTQRKNLMTLKIDDFPGGPEGFELVTRFFHNNGGDFRITVTNVALFYCCAIFMGITDDLLLKAQTFVEGMVYWSWKELVCCLKSCESVFSLADSNGLLEKLIHTLLSKIGRNNNSDTSWSSSSPETSTGFLFSSSCSSSKSWWFDDLTILPPKIIEKVINNNNKESLVMTKFLLHYLKLASAQRRTNTYPKSEFAGLTETTVRGVISSGKNSFTVRSLFSVLRILSSFGVRKELRLGLERLIGEALHESKLDDLLVSGNNNNNNGCGVYDVNLVIRLVRVFVNNTDEVSVQKLRKVGILVDRYLGEISPDQSLKVSKFLGVAESVPDSARDCFDGVYRAIDIYLESHPTLSSDERSKLCRCLNYQKLSLEACKELAKNPKIPPRITIQALISQQSKVPKKEFFGDQHIHKPSPINIGPKMAMYSDCDSESFTEQSDDVKIKLQRMQTRVVELEKVYREMKGQMSRMVRHNSFGTSTHSKNLPRLC